MSDIEAFLKENRIEEVECLVPDMAGIARGKILPAKKFLDGMHSNALRIPEGIFIQTVTGNYPDDAYENKIVSPSSQDVYLVPDTKTIRMVPWYGEPTAQIICDAFFMDGSPVEIASRYVLQRVLEL